MASKAKYKCKCDSCGQRSEWVLPSGWNFIKIEREIYTLCEGCGIGLSPGINYSIDDDAISPHFRELIKKRHFNK